MFTDLNNVEDESGQTLLHSQGDLLFVLLGKSIEGKQHEEMFRIWSTAARYIAEMYPRGGGGTWVFRGAHTLVIKI